MIDELKQICKTETEFNLLKYNTYRLNSSCFALVFPENVDQLKLVIDTLNKYNSKFFVIGNGSNIILPEYYDGVIIKLENFDDVKEYDDYVYVESGYMLNKLSIELSNKGYAGFEWSTGIPGSIGGSVFNNAGAYNSSISELLISATVLIDNEVKELSNEDLKFGYRTSYLKENKDKNIIVLSCKLKLEKGNIIEIKEKIKKRTDKRIATQDLSHPSCGSVFRNPEENPAGKLIEDAGLKGYSIEGAKVSDIHANFIINNGNATSKNIIDLIDYVKEKVKDKYDIDLILEQEIIK